KMGKYHNMTKESPAYITTIVLDSNLKWKYAETNWKHEWVPKARAMMEDLWEEYKPDP
ncbi:hypothetical protein BGZ57DRAFT_768153, partial [Hyaloscypha finlandica]